MMERFTQIRDNSVFHIDFSLLIKVLRFQFSTLFVVLPDGECDSRQCLVRVQPFQKL